MNVINIEKLCESYLEHSYRYYILDEPIIPDSYYDCICADIFAQIDNVPNKYSSIIDVDAMNATTGFHIRLHEYPDDIKAKCHE